MNFIALMSNNVWLYHTHPILAWEESSWWSSIHPGHAPEQCYRQAHVLISWRQEAILAGAEGWETVRLGTDLRRSPEVYLRWYCPLRIWACSILQEQWNECREARNEMLWSWRALGLLEEQCWTEHSVPSWHTWNLGLKKTVWFQNCSEKCF